MKQGGGSVDIPFEGVGAEYYIFRVNSSQPDTIEDAIVGSIQITDSDSSDRSALSTSRSLTSNSLSSYDLADDYTWVALYSGSVHNIYTTSGSYRNFMLTLNYSKSEMDSQINSCISNLTISTNSPRPLKFNVSIVFAIADGNEFVPCPPYSAQNNQFTLDGETVLDITPNGRTMSSIASSGRYIDTYDVVACVSSIQCLGPL